MRIFILVALIFSGNIFAQDINQMFSQVQQAVRDAGSAPQPGCPHCLSDTRLKKYRLPETPNTFNVKCRNFIKSDGTFGDWGKMIVTYINKSEERQKRYYNPALPGMQSAPHTCPNWGNMDYNEKAQFWVWMFASIAHVESSCNNRSVNTGSVPNPNDRPRGLFQLNTLKSTRSWRGPNCKFPSGAENVYNPANNIHCSLDIMDELLKGRSGEYRGNGKIFPTNSYWEKLRTEHSHTGGKIGQLVRMFPGCKLQ
jgi:hypothetical protein